MRSTAADDREAARRNDPSPQPLPEGEGQACAQPRPMTVKRPAGMIPHPIPLPEGEGAGMRTAATDDRETDCRHGGG